jgi:hypothetical protein
MTSTFEQSVYVSFLVCIIPLCYIWNIICSLRHRIKIVSENTEDFYRWNNIKRSELCKVCLSFENEHVRKTPSPKLQVAVVILRKWRSAYNVTDRLVTYQSEVTAHLKFLWSLLRMWIRFFWSSNLYIRNIS